MGVGSSNGIEDRLRAVLEFGCPPMPLPDFAKWAIALGRQLYCEANDGKRLFATLVVPDLRFVGLFLALGALDAAFAHDVARPQFAPGDAVSFINPSTTRAAIGTYVGTEDILVRGAERLYHVIEVKNGGRIKVPDQYGAIKRVGEPGSATAPAPTSFRGHQLPEWLPLVERCFHHPTLLQWLAGSTIAVQLVGVKAHLELEAEESLYGVGADGLLEVQLKRLLIWPPPRPLGSPVSVVAAGSHRGLVESPLTVFDGATAVIQNAQPGLPGTKVAIISPTTARSEAALLDLQSRLQFYDPVPGWVPEPGAVPGQVEWSCHVA